MTVQMKTKPSKSDLIRLTWTFGKIVFNTGDDSKGDDDCKCVFTIDGLAKYSDYIIKAYKMMEESIVGHDQVTMIEDELT